MEACENIIVENCRLSSSTCAIRIGYEGDAPIRNLSFKNLEIVDSRHGIDILSIVPISKLRIDHGTPMDHFQFEDIRMTNVGQAFFLWAGNEPPRKGYNGHMRNFVFKNITVRLWRAVSSETRLLERFAILLSTTWKCSCDLAELNRFSDFSRCQPLGDWLKCGDYACTITGVTMKIDRHQLRTEGFQAIETRGA